MFVLVRILSKYLKDRTMVVFGCFLLALANGWMMYIVPRAYNGKIYLSLLEIISRYDKFCLKESKQKIIMFAILKEL